MAVRRRDGGRSSCGATVKWTELRVGLELKWMELDGRLKRLEGKLEEEQDLVQ